MERRRQKSHRAARSGMKKRKGAGSLNQLLTFQQLAPIDPNEPDYGETHSDYVDVFTAPARLTPRLGSETVIASRLQGIQPYTITVRSTLQSRMVTPAWRAVNARTGAVYDIKSVVNVDERNAYLEMLVLQNG